MEMPDSPDRLLEELRRLSLLVIKAERGGPTVSLTLDRASNLAALVRTLDDWLSNGGFLPKEWQR